jgi:DNA-directed RNA polymerase specialized sigma24 family protein
MDSALNKALSQPEIGHFLQLAVDHADVTMRKFIWRGFRPRSTSQTELMVGDKTAGDFVNEALKRLCEGTRTYNPSKSFPENLNSVTDSLIWSEKKSSDRTGVVDYAEEIKEEGLPSDPISTATGSEAAADTKLLQEEIIADQRKCFQILKASFDGDKQMQDYLEALSVGYFDLTEISELTGIPVSKIYELRRKLKNHVPAFFGVTKYQELEQKIVEGK